MAEALALKRAVEVAADQGYNKVIFVSDCLSVIQRILSCKPDRSPVGMVVRDIKRMAMNFGSAVFRHVKHSLNEAAHILARTCDVTSLGFISFLLRLRSGRLFVLMLCDQ
jgi:ribonuclease HI